MCFFWPSKVEICKRWRCTGEFNCCGVFLTLLTVFVFCSCLFVAFRPLSFSFTLRCFWGFPTLSCALCIRLLSLHFFRFSSSSSCVSFVFALVVFLVDFYPFSLRRHWPFLYLLLFDSVPFPSLELFVVCLPLLFHLFPIGPLSSCSLLLPLSVSLRIPFFKLELPQGWSLSARQCSFLLSWPLLFIWGHPQGRNKSTSGPAVGKNQNIKNTFCSATNKLNCLKLLKI